LAVKVSEDGANISAGEYHREAFRILRSIHHVQRPYVPVENLPDRRATVLSAWLWVETATFPSTAK
jgi:hypothetical protein